MNLLQLKGGGDHHGPARAEFLSPNPFRFRPHLTGDRGYEARVSESYGKLPLQFEANRGQYPKDVRFPLARGRPRLYLTCERSVLVLTKSLTQRRQGKSVRTSHGLGAPHPSRREADSRKQPARRTTSSAEIARKVAHQRPTYAKVQYKNVIQGSISFTNGTSANSSTTSSSPPLHDPNKSCRLQGREKLAIDAQGRSVLHTLAATPPTQADHLPGMTDPPRYRRRYVRKGANPRRLSVARYDPTWPLVIDPVVLFPIRHTWRRCARVEES